jgi:hypothetical protein
MEVKIEEAFFGLAAGPARRVATLGKIAASE